MDLTVLRKRISSFKTPTGALRKVPDELAIEMLISWENWVGDTKSFYSAIDVSKYKMAGILGRAKRLKREGRFPDSDFKEIKLDSETGQVKEVSPCSGAEVVWRDGQIIRFSQVELLLEFLKKAA